MYLHGGRINATAHSIEYFWIVFAFLTLTFTFARVSVSVWHIFQKKILKSQPNAIMWWWLMVITAAPTAARTKHKSLLCYNCHLITIIMIIICVGLCAMRCGVRIYLLNLLHIIFTISLFYCLAVSLVTAVTVSRSSEWMLWNSSVCICRL